MIRKKSTTLSENFGPCRAHKPVSQVPVFLLVSSTCVLCVSMAEYKPKADAGIWGSARYFQLRAYRPGRQIRGPDVRFLDSRR
jgi:hypothetical protein